jgi:hydrogenase 3 maturation protease
MKQQGTPGFGVVLRRRLKEARRIAVVGTGDEFSPVDRLGMVAAQEIEKLHLPNVRVFFAGTMPESMTGPLREYQPDHVLFLDAADMGARPGMIAVIKPGKIRADLLSTHVLPLSVVMGYVEQDLKTSVTLLGIQPDLSRHVSGQPDGAPEYLERNLAYLSRILKDIGNKKAP